MRSIYQRIETLFPGTPAWLCMFILLACLAGCGGGQDEADDQTSAGGRLVPANLDTLLAETGSHLPENAVPAENGAQETKSEQGTAGSTPVDPPSGQIKDQDAPGTTPQIVESVETPAQTRPQSAAEGKFSLQVGSFSRPANAEALVAKLAAQGHVGTSEEAMVNGQLYHRVFIRGLSSEAAARNLGEELRTDLGISYLVLRR